MIMYLIFSATVIIYCAIFLLTKQRKPVDSNDTNLNANITDSLSRYKEVL